MKYFISLLVAVLLFGCQSTREYIVPESDQTIDYLSDEEQATPRNYPFSTINAEQKLRRGSIGDRSRIYHQQRFHGRRCDGVR